MSTTPASRVRTWSFYRLDSGLFTGFRGGGDEAWMRANTPPGCGALEGAHSAQAKRVNLATGTVEPCICPAPQATEWVDWRWETAAQRWQAVATPAALARDIRARRAKLLNACDWVVSRAAEAGQPVPPEWAAYRQALRDVPLQPGFPDAIEWPALPG